MTSRSKRRVLVIEDSAIDRRRLRTLFAAASSDLDMWFAWDAEGMRIPFNQNGTPSPLQGSGEDRLPPPWDFAAVILDVALTRSEESFFSELRGVTGDKLRSLWDSRKKLLTFYAITQRMNDHDCRPVILTGYFSPHLADLISRDLGVWSVFHKWEDSEELVSKVMGVLAHE